MGSFSKRLGPAVAFIMSALGLRLGLWTKHPAAPRGGVSFPGRYFFEEMLGRSDTSSAGVDLHLSDGGHFENLALYELVRRHCRYILVSDCGADADVAFDDLANATRRIREDFGVEIELDVEPLRPDGSGLSQQHAVVGTIHYDGTRGSDKGVILYFKPCLVGDEPTDVMQYRKRNAAFPHEGTGDQFYDEAQWESYRRLGEHSARAVFRYLEDTGLSRHGNAVERLFLAAIERWQRLRGVEPERILQLAHERDELTSEIQSKAPRFFRTELFAELVEPKSDAEEQLTDAELLDTMHVCIRIVAFMDRVYHLARLETSWSHGSNQVWMTFFGRVCGAPTFRNWWPLLRPWCSNALRDFVRIRFGVRIAEFARRDANNSNAVTSMKLLPPQASMGAKNSYALDRWRARHGEPQDESQVLQYVASFQGLPHGSPARHLVVGVLFYRELQATEGSRKCFAWTSPELFVPDALTGAGFSSRLLDAVIAHFGGEAAGHGAELRVSIQDDPTLGSEPQMVHRDPAHRQARRDTQHFYKSRGFEQSSDPEDRATLVLVLPQGVSGSA
jgi:GNAT superfamily N-acetyltransferase